MTGVFLHVESAAPMAQSLAAGDAVEPAFRRGFIDGAGGARVYPEMFELARRLLDGSFTVPIDKVADAVRLLVERNHVVAEGAGALSFAAAIDGLAGSGKICCVVSGGNINGDWLASILQGAVPAFA
jgi:threonine dehydratase